MTHVSPRPTKVEKSATSRRQDGLIIQGVGWKENRRLESLRHMKNSVGNRFQTQGGLSCPQDVPVGMCIEIRCQDHPPPTPPVKGREKSPLSPRGRALG